MLSLHNNAVPDLSGTRQSSKKSRLRLDDDCTTKLLNREPLAKAGGSLVLGWSANRPMIGRNPCDNGPSVIEWVEFAWLYGALAQLARAPALQAGGPGFESLTLHHTG